MHVLSYLEEDFKIYLYITGKNLVDVISEIVHSSFVQKSSTITDAIFCDVYNRIPILCFDVL